MERGSSNKGEIITLLTIGAFLVITAASMISSVFLSKNKQTTQSLAQSVCNDYTTTNGAKGGCDPLGFEPVPGIENCWRCKAEIPTTPPSEPPAVTEPPQQSPQPQPKSCGSHPNDETWCDGPAFYLCVNGNPQLLHKCEGPEDNACLPSTGWHCEVPGQNNTPALSPSQTDPTLYPVERDGRCAFYDQSGCNRCTAAGRDCITIRTGCFTCSEALPPRSKECLSRPPAATWCNPDGGISACDREGTYAIANCAQGCVTFGPNNAECREYVQTPEKKTPESPPVPTPQIQTIPETRTFVAGHDKTLEDIIASAKIPNITDFWCYPDGTCYILGNGIENSDIESRIQGIIANCKYYTDCKIQAPTGVPKK